MAHAFGNDARCAKSPDDWTSEQLEAYNIAIREQNQSIFFDGALPDYHGPAGFIQYENRIQGLDPDSLSLMKHLDLLEDTRDEGGPDTGDLVEFVATLVRTLGYETEDALVQTYKAVPLVICGAPTPATADACLLDTNTKTIQLLIHEDKTHVKPYNEEAALVAQAIGAFQKNNRRRVDDMLLEPLNLQVIPGIIMLGSLPKFYKIPITAELDRCVRHGEWPTVKTTVLRHTPRLPGSTNSGMRTLDNREFLLRCFEGFKRYVLHPEQS
ncbi:hypothetical protein LshimejAT787_1202940 [Lyophyllum shimeji]|uniref:Uncharacterized protein n=1 Tax=Lyophyllum shimeji TaxID=47721 RepID=A0A9P3PVL5_LYOSH|nr:hypothetical protein LshimejAT787_1202940 [Lyophyllum shimeji]